MSELPPSPSHFSPERTVWLLSVGSPDGLQLGPILRVLQMARLAKARGFQPVLAFEKGREGLFEGMRTCRLGKDTIRQIAAGDAVVVVAMIGISVIKALLDSKIGFDTDLYGLGALEHIEMTHEDLGPRRVYQSRRRLRLRYRFLVENSERVYLSNPHQLVFLGGMLFSEGDARSCEVASTLPEKVLFLPMGVQNYPKAPLPNPYPANFHGRPVFLWGGGIWSWFDTDTLLKSFRTLKDQGSDAALFFICGSNPSGLQSHDEPVRRALRQAADLGLLGNTVAFHERGASSQELPAYLQHCSAGIMANPRHLESIGSWRTRLLDVLAYGKPAIVAGFDPLSEKLATAGAALVCPSGNSHALAGLIAKFLADGDLRVRLERGSRSIGQEMSWEKVFDPWLCRLSDPDAFRPSRHRVGFLHKILFITGA